MAATAATSAIARAKAGVERGTHVGDKGGELEDWVGVRDRVIAKAASRMGAGHSWRTTSGSSISRRLCEPRVTSTPSETRNRTSWRNYCRAFGEYEGYRLFHEHRFRGAIHISDNGCGMTSWLIIAGPHRGEIWFRD